MWYVFIGNIIIKCYTSVCAMRVLFCALFQLVSKFYATHKIHWLNVIEYGPLRAQRRLAVYTEDATANFGVVLFCSVQNQRILIKLMPLMLPSLTNCNPTYMSFIFTFISMTHTYIVHRTHPIHFPHSHPFTSNPFTLHIAARVHLFFFHKFKSKLIRR